MNVAYNNKTIYALILMLELEKTRSLYLNIYFRIFRLALEITFLLNNYFFIKYLRRGGGGGGGGVEDGWLTSGGRERLEYFMKEISEGGRLLGTREYCFYSLISQGNFTFLTDHCSIIIPLRRQGSVSM